MDSLPHPWRYVFTPGCQENAAKKRKELKGTKRTTMSETHVGADYTEEEQEWLRVITSFHQKHRRYPTLQEAFAIAHALGYRKESGEKDDAE